VKTLCQMSWVVEKDKKRIDRWVLFVFIQACICPMFVAATDTFG
jgi:hypothetical protein